MSIVKNLEPIRFSNPKIYLERFGVLDSDFEAVVVDEEGGVILKVDRLEDLQLSVLKCSTFSCSMISFFRNRK
jgi:hypothetical protein